MVVPKVLEAKQSQLRFEQSKSFISVLLKSQHFLGAAKP